MAGGMFDALGGLGNLGGALGGIVGGLAKAGLVPQDDPGVKLMSAKSELADLERQQAELFGAIGRKVYAADGAAAFPDEAAKLRLLDSSIASARSQAEALQTEHDAASAAQAQATAARTCPGCGTVNAEGVSFCSECGTRLGPAAPVFCTSCGAQLEAGTKFCGSCGARAGE